ncbi:hypothetical protein RZS08_67295, partial [Arthrospira platensis SPKY1]|nr:hypothetical protein [Arthrospira platensis SPKY1]
RHEVPVHAAHVLAPAENLANEPLGAGNGYEAIAIRLLRPTHHLERMQQPHVDDRRQGRMQQLVLAGHERIFVRAELGQPLRHEAFEPRLRITSRDRQAE